MAYPRLPPDAPEEAKIAAERNFKIAKEFYENDHELSKEQRIYLWKAFRLQGIATPVSGFGSMVGGIYGARYLAKAGRIPKTTQGGFSFVFAVTGLFVGGFVGNRLSYGYNVNRLPDEKSQAAYEILGFFPPMIGMRYYESTARDTSKIMADPETWKKFYGFPFGLLASTDPELMNRSPFGTDIAERAGRLPNQGYQSNRSTPTPRISNQDPNNRESTQAGNSWERLRQQRNSISSQVTVSSDDNDFVAEQLEFDKELEEERNGVGLQDDFSESEKKWS